MRWPCGTVALCLACSILGVGPAAGADHGSDAIIMVQPQLDQALIMVTFSGRRDHAEVQDRLAVLASSFRARLSGVRVADRRLTSKRVSDGRQQGAVFVHTSAVALLSGAAAVRGGGFVLQPYVAAFGDLARWEVMYLVSRSPDMRPLRQLAAPALTVTLTTDGSPYRYVFERGDRQADLPVLPLTQSQPVETDSQPRARDRRGAAFAGVIALSAACGLAVFVLLMVWARAKQTRMVR